jgi:hypothetical protein
VQSVPDLTFLAPIVWVLVDGIALRAYMPERATQDVDIIIHAQDEARAQEAFIRAGYTITGPLTIEGFSANDPSGNTLDVFTSSASWLDKAFASPGRDAAGYPVMPRPYLMLLKMEAGRPQDWVDVQRMLRDTPASERSATRTLIARYVPELVEDFDSLITLADWEFGTT